MSDRPIACRRCGVRSERRKTSALCRDCRFVLSKEEQALWANVPVVSNVKEAA